MRALRNQGRAPGDTWLSHTHLGYNYRLDEITAALGRCRWSGWRSCSAGAQQVVDWYDRRLAEIPGVEMPIVVPSTTRMRWFVYVIRLTSRFRPRLSRLDGSAVYRCGPISFPSTSSPTWSSASVGGRAISPSPRTWVAWVGRAFLRGDDRGAGGPGLRRTTERSWRIAGVSCLPAGGV